MLNLWKKDLSFLFMNFPKKNSSILLGSQISKNGNIEESKSQEGTSIDTLCILRTSFMTMKATNSSFPWSLQKMKILKIKVEFWLIKDGFHMKEKNLEIVKDLKILLLSKVWSELLLKESLLLIKVSLEKEMLLMSKGLFLTQLIYKKWPRLPSWIILTRLLKLSLDLWLKTGIVMIRIVLIFTIGICLVWKDFLISQLLVG